MTDSISVGPGILIALGIYLLFLIGIGWMGRRSQKGKTLSEFFLAGRSFGFVVLFLTLYATQYSGNTFMAFPGETYRFGIGYIYSIAMMMSIILGYLFFAPRLVVLARERGYITPTDAISDRFPGAGLRVLSALLLSWGLINYLLAQLVAMGRATDGLFGPWFAEHGLNAHMTAVIALAAVMLIYESLGGMRAVAWTDVLQGIMLLFGLGVIAFFAVVEFGGLPATMETVRQHSPEKMRMPTANEQRTMLSSILLLLIGGPMYPHAIQRLYAARDLTSLRRSLGLMSFLPLLSTLPVFLFGLVALAQFPALSDTESDKATTLLLSRLIEVRPGLYWVVGAVYLAAIAAIMSTADSALLSLSSILTQDLYRPLFKTPPDQAHLYRVGKILSLVVLAILVWIAIDPSFTLWSLLEVKFEVLIQTFPAFAVGLYSRRLTTSWVFGGMAAGTLLSVGLYGAHEAGWMESSKVWGFHGGLCGLALNLGICFLGIGVVRRRENRRVMP